MKPVEVFGLAARILGLLVLASLWMWFWTFVGGVLGGFAALMISGGAALALGVWLLNGAPGIVSVAYPEEKKDR